MKKKLFFLLCAAFMGISSSIAAPTTLFPGLPPATLPSRLAFIVGIQYYPGTGGMQLRELPDAKDDADAMEAVAEQFGFEITRVKASKNITISQIRSELKDFKEKALKLRKQSKRGPIILFYFSGHGFTAGEENYLVPSDFFANTMHDATQSSLSLKTDVVAILSEAEPSLQIIVTDACRSMLPFKFPDETGTPGTKKPSKSLPEPDKYPFGNNRKLFLYSTLDEKAAYGEGDRGGRFTRAFVAVLADTWGKATAPTSSPITPEKPSLRSIFDKAKYEMAFESTEKWQVPDIDEAYASTFFPIPTERDFKLEQESWENFRTIPGPTTWDKLLERQTCILRTMLFEFSEFSYYSGEIIKTLNGTLQQLGSGGVNCLRSSNLTNGTTLPVNRDERGRWEVPKKWEAPTNNERPNNEPRGGLFQLIPRNTWPANIAGGKSHQLRFAQSESSPSGNLRLGASRPPEPPVKREQVPASHHSFVSLTFGDVQRIASNLAVNVPLGALPGPEVPLSRAVVTKGDVFLRSSIGVQSPIMRAMPPGEVLEIIEASPGQTWLRVRHPTFGIGFVSGDLVEPALAFVSTIVDFDQGTIQLSETAQKDLLATFGLLGGVVIVDASAEYPQADKSIGFTRASIVAARFEEAVNRGNPHEKTPLYMALTPTNDPTLASDKVRVTILAFPLDQTTRANLAKLSSSLSPVKIDIAPPSLVPLEPAAPPNSKPSLEICNSAGEKCGIDAELAFGPGPNNDIKKAYQDVLTNAPKSVHSSPGALFKSLYR